MSLISRFARTFFGEDDGSAGLYEKADGSIWVRQPDGSEAEVGAGGGGPWGGASSAKFSGSGSPVGVVTPSGEGDLYVDATTPALWQATGATAADWQQVSGGGSMPFKLVRVPLAFDTPDLVLTGIPIYVPTPGEYFLARNSGSEFAFLQVDAAWDGATPTLHLTLASAGGLDALFDLSAAGSNYWEPGSDYPLKAPDGTPLVAMVDDGAGGDPGSIVGAGELIFYTIPAP